MLFPFLLFLLSSPIDVTAEPCSIQPTRLRCENLIDPVGIDERRPRLSWILEPTDPAARGLFQSGYRILVASSPEHLAREDGDLWDSDLVSSDRTDQIEYAGVPLVSGARYCWKVLVYDGQGLPSAWSEPAEWTVGLLEPADWQGSWIGYDAALELATHRPTLKGASWIRFPEVEGEQPTAEPRFFRHAFEWSADTALEEASIMISADDGFELWVNGEFAGASDSPTPAWKRPSCLRLDHLLAPGRNVLAVATSNLTPGPTACIARLMVRSRSGEVVEVMTGDDGWRCAAEVTEGWFAPDFDDSTWRAADVVGELGVQPWGAFVAGDPILPPPRYLRRGFRVEKPVRRALAHGSALGIFELRINGEKVGDHYFDPGWTDYGQRVYYRTFDVTSLLREGDNAFGAILGDGWYSGYVGYKPERDHYGRDLRLRTQLVIEYEDGTSEVIASDPSWRATTGPIVESDFLMGEVYDARRELTGWDQPGFSAESWANVDVTEAIPAVVEAHPGPPVRAIEEFPPQSIAEPRPGVYVLDLGRNFAGFCRVRMRGRPGQVLQLRFAERLNPDGTLYTTNLRAARATDSFVFRGGGEVEEWEPRFTFHGFQYVEVTGLDEPPPPGSIVGLALSSDTPLAGSFECSDEVVNQLVSNIRWTQHANFIDIPTDCPQRDERLGWTGDAQIYVRTAALFTDVQAFFTKWLVDLADAQREDGQFPMVAPLKVAGGDGGPGWADAGTICPWAIYQVYGDRRLLERHYDGMVRFVEFCEKRSEGGLLPPEKFHCFGDWVSVGANTPKTVIYTAYYAHSVELTARAANELGRERDVERYGKLFQRIRDAFVATYVDEDGRIEGNTQCVYVMALAFDLLEGELAEKAAAHLVERIEARDGHLSTGFLGTKDLMLVLSKIGREDVAYRLLHNDTYPSWGFSIKHGATSIWERWNGWTPEQGFMDPGMNSFAHYSFGAVGQWLFENVGGIRPAMPGYRWIEVAPRPGGRISWAEVGHETVRGTVRARWLNAPTELTLEVTVPPNVRATIRVPFGERGEVTENGRPVESLEGITAQGYHDGAANFHVGSGTYTFRVDKVPEEE